jgi:hypothetical protein
MGEMRSFSLEDLRLAAREAYADGYLAALWHFESRLRRGMPWPSVYMRLRDHTVTTLRAWTEDANADPNEPPAVEDNGDGKTKANYGKPRRTFE